MRTQLSTKNRQDISSYLGISESELDNCPATLEAVNSPGCLIFEYKVIFSASVPSCITSDLEDGCSVRVPAWLIDER